MDEESVQTSGLVFSTRSPPEQAVMLDLLPTITIYCLLIALASLAGGAFPILSRLSHTGMQVSISFVGGVMLGVGILHMLPHAATDLGGVPGAARWMLLGFVVMFFLQRFSHFHHHETTGSDVVVGQDHSHPPGSHSHCGHTAAQSAETTSAGATNPQGAISWGTFALGLGLHSLLDGVALAASVQADRGQRLAGLATFLAILLHKPFDSLTITLLMAGRGASVQMRQLMNLAFALVVPLGVMLFWGSIQAGLASQHFIGPSLGFAAGVFVCIAASDLLPEVQFHSHDRLRLSGALLAGILLAWMIELSHAH